MVNHRNGSYEMHGVQHMVLILIVSNNVVKINHVQFKFSDLKFPLVTTHCLFLLSFESFIKLIS